MAGLVVPVVISWELPAELAAAVRDRGHPCRLRVVPRGGRGAWVEVMVLPLDTAGYTPAEDCCTVPLPRPSARTRTRRPPRLPRR